ncbi:MAG: peroxidase-related enzyme [Planctomycetota bacterium]
MAYIETIAESDATGELAELYGRFANADGLVDNAFKVHSLNPESMLAHHALYAQSLHRPSPVSRVEREIVGVWVSRANGCGYCLEHHAAGLERLLPNDRKGLGEELKAGDVSSLSERERAMVVYAEALALTPGEMSAAHVEALREGGLTDREILDLCQAVGYFAYGNRMMLGLGTQLGVGEGAIGEVLEDAR